MGTQAIVWFVLAGAGLLFALWLLVARYVRKDPQIVHSGAGFYLYTACVLLFAFGALAAALFSAAAGR